MEAGPPNHVNRAPLVEGCRPSACMRRAAAWTDAWLWLATISSARSPATAPRTRSTHLTRRPRIQYCHLFPGSMACPAIDIFARPTPAHQAIIHQANATCAQLHLTRAWAGDGGAETADLPSLLATSLNPMGRC